MTRIRGKVYVQIREVCTKGSKDLQLLSDLIQQLSLKKPRQLSAIAKIIKVI